MRIPKIRASWIVPPRRIHLWWHSPAAAAYATRRAWIPSLAKDAGTQARILSAGGAQASDQRIFQWLTK
jgi:hypothetical protein